MARACNEEEKYAGEGVREVGGKIQKKKPPKKPPQNNNKKIMFSSLLPHPEGWKHLPGFATPGSAAWSGKVLLRTSKEKRKD